MEHPTPLQSFTTTLPAGVPERVVPPPVMPPVVVRNWDTTADNDPAASTGYRIRRVVRDLLETALSIILIFLIVRGTVQNFKIEGSSMEPTLHSAQYILVNKLVYLHFDLNAPLRLVPGNQDLPERTLYPFRGPQRGDIIVFEYPNDVRRDYIKRVIGLPGDTVEVRNGQVYVNGQHLDEPYLDKGAETFCQFGSECQAGAVHVPEGAFFVMGDNRGNSSDSREWGLLKADYIIGKAWFLYYPPEQFGFIRHHNYIMDGATPEPQQ